jgi:membrane protein YdbS with pleckstrin-like domain
MKFRSAISPALIVFLAIVLGTVALSMLMKGAWLGFIIVLIQCIFITLLYRTTSYVVGPDELVISCGFFYKQRIPWASIRKVKYSSSPLSSPAFSLKRIRIDYGKMGDVMISPHTRERFMDEIRPFLSEEVETKN